MRLWDVCEIHDSRKYAMKKPPERCDFVMLHGNWKSDPPCVFVPMRLIPDNAETVNRDQLAKAVRFVESGPGYIDWGHMGILAAAARAYLALDGETP